MKKLLLLLVLVGGMAQAQHIEGTTTIQTISSTKQDHYKVIVMGNSEYLETSYVVDTNLFKLASFEGKTLEPGKMYMVSIEGNVITNVAPWGWKWMPAHVRELEKEAILRRQKLNEKQS